MNVARQLENETDRNYVILRKQNELPQNTPKGNVPF